MILLNVHKIAVTTANEEHDKEYDFVHDFEDCFVFAGAGHIVTTIGYASYKEQLISGEGLAPDGAMMFSYRVDNMFDILFKRRYVASVDANDGFIVGCVYLPTGEKKTAGTIYYNAQRQYYGNPNHKALQLNIETYFGKKYIYIEVRSSSSATSGSARFFLIKESGFNLFKINDETLYTANGKIPSALIDRLEYVKDTNDTNNISIIRSKTIMPAQIQLSKVVPIDYVALVSTDAIFDCSTLSAGMVGTEIIIQGEQYYVLNQHTLIPL